MEIERESLEELLKIAESHDILCAEARAQIARKLEQLLKITVRKIAERTIKENPTYYSKALLQLIPTGILDAEVTDDNLHELGERIDEIRFEKEKELATMIGLYNIAGDPKQRETLKKIINCKLDSLPIERESKRKEIKFLSNLAQIIIHQ